MGHMNLVQLTDTHCHIHSVDYPLDAVETIERARASGVGRLICVGTDEGDSALAVDFVRDKANCWASVAVHPHEAGHGMAAVEGLRDLLSAPSVSPPPSTTPTLPSRLPLGFSYVTGTKGAAKVGVAPDGFTEEKKNEKIIAIGECGLDCFYQHSSREQQIPLLHAQIELAIEHHLPLIFHVREAFDDFWPIFDQYSGLRGVLHSFTDSEANLDKALTRGLYVGVNGISTFTKDDAQKAMFARIPLQSLLLETDAPFLTPVPKRGSINEPALLTLVAQNVCDLRHITLEELSQGTSQNATRLFNLN